MTSRSAAEVAFGVMGVYFVAGSIPGLVGATQMSAEGSSLSPHLDWIAYLGPVLFAATGIGMLVLRRALAVMLAPASEPVEEASGTAGIQAAAIAVIGVSFFASGLQLFLAEQLMTAGLGSRKSMQAPAEMAVGALLFLGARGIVVVWQWLRTAGRSSP